MALAAALAPITAPSSITINHISLTIVTLRDEIFKSSSISVLTDLNDITEVQCHTPVTPNYSQGHDSQNGALDLISIDSIENLKERQPACNVGKYLSKLK